MHVTLLCLLSAGLPAASQPNLDFATGTLAQCGGSGFHVVAGTGRGPSIYFGVGSSDGEEKGRKALLYRTFVVPPGAGASRFKAAAFRPRGVSTEGQLVLVMETAGRKIVPRRVRLG